MVRRGSITIFLCLMLSTVMIVVSSLTEVVRVRGAYAHFDRKLQVVLNSIMANYDKHLFDDYGILAFDKALEGGTVNETTLQEFVAEYFTKNTIEGFNNKGFITNLKYQDEFVNLYQFNIDKIKIINMSSIVENNAVYLKQQIVDNMKYKLVLVGINKFTDLTTALEKTEVTSKAIEKKAEVDEAEQKLATQVIELITLIDGIEYKKGKPKIKEGRYSIKSNFVKKISVGNPTMNSQKINNLELFEDIKPYTNNIEESFDSIIQEYTTLTRLKESLLRLENEKTEITIILDTSSELKQEQIDHYKKRLSELEVYINSYLDIIKTSNVDRKEYYLTVKGLIQDNINISREVLEKIEQYHNNASTLIGIKDSFVTFLDENKEGLTEDIYKSLRPEPNSEGSKYGNIIKMKETINQNLELFESTQVTSFLNLIINESSTSFNNDYLIGIEKRAVEAAKDKVKRLSKEALEFDYSGYSIGGIQADDPRDLLTSGASGRLEDYEDITGEKSIDTKDLPSTLFEQVSKEVEDADFDEQQFTKDAFAGFALDANTVSNASTNLFETMLINEYILGTFMSISDYTKDGNKTILCDIPFDKRALNYEVEYIISGKSSDLKNKISVAAKLLLVRFCFNFIHAIADSEKRNIALSLATAIVGPASAFGLNVVVQFLLLGAWALAESAYDVEQLFKGEKLPIIKTKQDWKTSITGAIKEVTKEEKEDKIFDVGYEDYLRLLLVTSTTEQERLYRIMDVMQLNLQKQHGENTHKMQNMMYEFDLEGSATIKSVFLPKRFNFFTDSNNAYSIKSRKRRAY